MIQVSRPANFQLLPHLVKEEHFTAGQGQVVLHPLPGQTELARPGRDACRAVPAASF